MGFGVLAVMVAVAGCGGGAKRHEQRAGAATPRVTEQVRQALADSLKRPFSPNMSTAQLPRLPFVAVASCAGPVAGGAGSYRCVTTPRGAHGMRSVTVRVKSDGSWSTQPIRVPTGVHGHGTPAVTAIWGAGIQLPS
jgi:hypothetical protein